MPTVRSLQRIADTFGVPRAMLDSLAGYPSGESEDAGDAPDDLARRAEIRACLAWFGEQLDDQVPRELWQIYADGCAALARALDESYRATMTRADTVALTSPAERHEATADEPRPRREIGFRS